MNHTCVSIRGKKYPGERCTAAAKPGTEWCGRHAGAASQVRFVEPDSIEHVAVARSERGATAGAGSGTGGGAGSIILRTWRRWLARRAGPLLWFREESNNPYDFYSADPVTEIPLRDFVSFVSGGKGYVMDIKSAQSLLAHATKTGSTPENPFNREPLPAVFLRRIARHQQGVTWVPLAPVSETQAIHLAVTDVCSAIDELGYYTDPAWFTELNLQQLQRLYIEIADIWMHRAMLSHTDRVRIVPAGYVLPVAVYASLHMSLRGIRKATFESCTRLVTAALSRADRQLGVMYVLGALSLVCDGCGAAYPWLVDMFTPGVTRVVNGKIHIAHPTVLTY